MTFIKGKKIRFLSSILKGRFPRNPSGKRNSLGRKKEEKKKRHEGRREGRKGTVRASGFWCVLWSEVHSFVLFLFFSYFVLFLFLSKKEIFLLILHRYIRVKTCKSDFINCSKRLMINVNN